MPIRIVIVEDLDEVREGLKNFISLDPEFDVIRSFNNAEDAANEMANLNPDIVIMDINFPGMSGITCIEKIKPQCPDTQFMMFTVYENDEKVFEALKAGASGYLLKKTGPAHIIEALKELYNGGSPMSSNIARKLVNAYQKNEQIQDRTGLILSARENEILILLSNGLLYKEIAEKLKISTNTVRQHIHHIYEKLHVQNRTEAINKLLGRN
jgi:DNA-binding NarL/FixJ family response regulator